MNTTSNYLVLVTAQLNASTSVASPRFARGSSEHRLADYAVQYEADKAELASEMASNPFTRSLVS